MEKEPQLGCPYSLDWTTGLDYWTGILDSKLKSPFPAVTTTEVPLAAVEQFFIGASGH